MKTIFTAIIWAVLALLFASAGVLNTICSFVLDLLEGLVGILIQTLDPVFGSHLGDMANLLASTWITTIVVFATWIIDQFTSVQLALTLLNLEFLILIVAIIIKYILVIKAWIWAAR